MIVIAVVIVIVVVMVMVVERSDMKVYIEWCILASR